METMATAAATDLTGVIASASAGDEVAFAMIVADHHEDMRRVCTVVCGNETIAEEAAQAAWSIAWRRLASLREPERLRPWLVSVAVNEAKQLLRKRRRASALEVTVDASRTAGGIDPAIGIDLLDLRSALDRLDPDERALLAMRYVAGFDATELAAATGISPAGTRTRLKRSLDRLRKELI
jgi:RNA polymerase sigma-70 factor (ECF subfamily)